MDESYHAIVIGGGLAGSTAAIELGDRGLKTLVLEKGLPGKDKPCGDAFLPSAISILREYGLEYEDFVLLNGVPFHEIHLYNNINLIWKHRIKKFQNNTGWLIPRNLIDQKLRDIAQRNTTISYGCNVQNVELVCNKVWKVSYRQNDVNKCSFAEAIILATGATNRIPKLWNVSGNPRDSISISAYTCMKNINYFELIFQFINELKPGYGWIFPLGEGKINIGICSLDNDKSNLKKVAEDYLLKWNLSEKVKWRGGKAPLWSGSASQWHHPDGLISCGDAAGLVDPANSEGITPALISGKNAGIAISNFILNSHDATHLENYSSFIYYYCSNRYKINVKRLIWKKLCTGIGGNLFKYLINIVDRI